MSVRLHPKHGVNPTIPVCWWCRESKNEVALLGAAYEGQVPMHMIMDRVPCEQCREWMTKGIILVDARDGADESDLGARGQCFVVVTEACVRRMPFDDPVIEHILQKRVAILEVSVWKQLGLPTSDAEAAALDAPIKT